MLYFTNMLLRLFYPVLSYNEVLPPNLVKQKVFPNLALIKLTSIRLSRLMCICLSSCYYDF